MNAGRAGLLAFKYRGGVWTLFFLLILFCVSPGMPVRATGLVSVALGQGIRFWAAGSIGLYRGEAAGAAQLVTWGPYALVRNPLYLGNALIGAGWCSLSGKPMAFVIFLVVFITLYVLLVIPYEEGYLKERFPGEYARYSERVGRFFPLKKPSPAEFKGPFDWGVLWKSERHSLWVTLIGTLLLFSRRWW